MTYKTTLAGIKLSFTFRHKWDEIHSSRLISWPEYRLGLWYRRFIKVTSFDLVSKGSVYQLRNLHQFGVNLIVCKFWLEVGRNR